MLVTLPDPTSASFTDWAAELSEALGFAVKVPEKDTEWREFGFEVVGLPQVAERPSPAFFNDWRSWALAFMG